MGKQSTGLFEKVLKKELGVDCVTEFRFHPIRRWKADYAILEHKILLEVEGAVWVQGRHTRGSGFVKDMLKYNTATSMGYSVLRVVPKDLLGAGTLDLIKETIKNRNGVIH